jgi:hypothetical protein
MTGWAYASYWYVGIAVITNLLFSIVISIGGGFDLVWMFKSLKEEVVDETDDGRVITESEK